MENCALVGAAVQPQRANPLVKTLNLEPTQSGARCNKQKTIVSNPRFCLPIDLARRTKIPRSHQVLDIHNTRTVCFSQDLQLSETDPGFAGDENLVVCGAVLT